jgi:hypothetical protein
MEDFIMDNVLEMLMGMVATKPINITVNVYGGVPGVSGVSELLDSDECDGDCDLCDCCCDEGAEDCDELVSCEDCEDAKYAMVWETFKEMIVQQMPISELKVQLLKTMQSLENSILD